MFSDYVVMILSIGYLRTGFRHDIFWPRIFCNTDRRCCGLRKHRRSVYKSGLLIFISFVPRFFRKLGDWKA